MKKLLLTLTVALVAASMSAQTWMKPAVWGGNLDTAKEKQAYLHCSVAADGSVYKTGSYDKDFKFADQTIINSDELLSAYLAKYTADGKEEWVATLFGAASITAITTDADGNVYIAGTFEDDVVLKGGTGVAYTGILNSPMSASAYVAKVSKNGEISAVKTFTSETNADIASIVGDPWDMGFDMSIYDMSFNDPLYVRPTKLQVDGGKVYMAAQYVGDVAELGWKGAYQNMFDMMIFDLRSFGIVSLSAENLTDVTSVATVQATGTVLYTDESNYPESLTFAVDNGDVYAAFTGFKRITLATADGAKDFEMPAHAAVVAKIGGEAKLFGVPGHDKTYVTDAIKAMEVADGKLYIGGSFYDQLPFNNEIVAKGTDLYVAALNANDFSVVWTAVSGYEEEEPIQQCEVFGNLVVNNGKVYFDGAAESNDGKTFLSVLGYNVAEDGTLTKAEEDANGATACISDNGNGITAVVYSNGYLSVFKSVGTGIQTVKPADSKGTQIYDLNGCPVAVPAQGIYIVNGKKVLY